MAESGGTLCLAMIAKCVAACPIQRSWFNTSLARWPVASVRGSGSPAFPRCLLVTRIALPVRAI